MAAVIRYIYLSNTASISVLPFVPWILLGRCSCILRVSDKKKKKKKSIERKMDQMELGFEHDEIYMRCCCLQADSRQAIRERFEIPGTCCDGKKKTSTAA